MNIAVEFRLIIISKGEVRLNSRLLLVIGCGEIECKDIALEELLVDHLVENWSHASLGKGWVGQSDNGLEVGARENGVLLLDVAELLVLDMDLPT